MSIQRIIETLNKGEKKVISIRLQAEKKRQLSSLFKHYTNDATTVKESEITTISKQQLTILKYQLKELILDEMTRTSRCKLVEMRFYSKLTKIIFLKDRFLFDEALKLIPKLKEELIDFERFTILQELIMLEAEIHSSVMNKSRETEKIHQLIVESDKNILRMNELAHNKSQYLALSSDLNYQYSTSFSSMNQMFDEHNKSSFVFYHRARMIRCLNEKNHELLLESAIIIFKLIRENPHEFDNHPIQKIDMLFHCSLSFLICGDTFSFTRAQEVLISVDSNLHHVKQRKHDLLSFLSSTSRLESYGDDHSKHFRQIIESDISVSSDEYEQYIKEQTANYYLSKKEFRKAVRVNNEILNYQSAYRQSKCFLRAEIRCLLLAIIMGKTDYAEKLFQRLQSQKVLTHSLHEKLIEELLNGTLYPDTVLNHTINYVFHYSSKKTIQLITKELWK